MNYINTLMAQIFMVIAMLYLDEGQAWLDSSYGINPLIAGAVALSCVVLPYALTTWLQHRHTVQWEHIEELDDLLDKYRDTIDELNRASQL